MPDYAWDLIDHGELNAYVRQFDDEVLQVSSDFVLGRYLPDVRVQEISFTGSRGGRQDVHSAVYRAWDTPTPMTGRQGRARFSGKLAPLGRSIPLTEEEDLMLRALQRNIEPGNDPAFINQIYSDVELMVRAVRIRVEFAKGDLIDDGKIVLEENGLQLVADWGRRPEARGAFAVVWSDPTAPILTNLLTLTEDYEEINGSLPSHFVLSRQASRYLTTNTEMREYNTSVGGVVPKRLTMEDVAATLDREGIPEIRTYDGQLRNSLGQRVRVLNPNKIYAMPPEGEPAGETQFGVTLESMVMVQQGILAADEAPGIIALVTQNPHPVQTFTHGGAVALPIMPNPDVIFDKFIL